MPILTQPLSVDFTLQRGCEGMLYNPYPLDRDQTYPPYFQCVPRKLVEQGIADIRHKVDMLLKQAELGHGRAPYGIEEAAASLGRKILPSCGLIGLLGPGTYPQIDTASSSFSDIPWEAIEERYFECPRYVECPEQHQRALEESRFCRTCGAAMRPRGGKLALAYHLSYFSRGRDRSLSQGNRFLFILDPREDLCSTENDPEGVCRRHLTQIVDLAKALGFEPSLLKGENATHGQVLGKLGDPSVAAVYYFGHGYFSRCDGEGCLLLANDAELYASEIEEAAPGARFVFLNACLGAAAGNYWDIERRSGSIAEAFVRGNPNKVVIAPLFPVMNVQAAEAAVSFLTEAIGGSTCGEAMAKTRQQSLERYETGEPHITWMAYRYFGDPNKPLQATEKVSILAPGTIELQPVRRVFDDQGRFNKDLFRFAVDDVLLRATKRRLLLGRELIGLADLLAGLIRRGDLMRFVLRSREIAPDELYQTLSSRTDEELGLVQTPTAEPNGASVRSPMTPGLDTPAKTAESTLGELFSQWTVREEAQFERRVSELLVDTDEDAQRHGGPSAQICEQDLLLRLIDTPEWRRLTESLGLLSAEDVRNLLVERQSAGRIDENGAIILPPLAPEARKIVDIALALAQQSGMCPIPNRTILAAFLQPDGGYVERCFEHVGLDPMESYLWMLAASAVSGAAEPSKHWFGLSQEAGERVLLPTLEHAQALASDVVTETDLFRGFCEVADTAFKSWLKDLLGIDLDELRQLDCGKEPECLSRLTPEARRVIFRAHRLAQTRGVFPIPNRTVLAAFVADPEGLVSRVLRAKDVAPNAVSSLILGATGYGSPQKYPLDTAACERAVAPAIERAKALTKDENKVTETLLFQAFCEVAPTDFKEWLKNGLNIDLDALATEATARAATSSDDADDGSISQSELSTPPPASSPILVDAATDNPHSAAPVGAAEIDQVRLDEALSWVLSEAIRIAKQAGLTQVRTPHLVAAMIGDGTTLTATALQRCHIDPVQLKRTMLDLVPAQNSGITSGRGAALGDPGLGENVTAVLGQAIALAGLRDQARATVHDLLAALLSDKGGPIGEFLRGLGVKADP